MYILMDKLVLHLHMISKQKASSEDKEWHLEKVLTF